MRWRRLKPGAVRETLVSLGTPQSSEERALVDTIACCTERLLRDEGFAVSSNGKFIRIVGTGPHAGKSTIMMQAFLWRTPLPLEERLRLMFESYATRLQEFLSNASGAAWPAPHAIPRVTISDTMITVSWEDPGQNMTILEMLPINRAEIGIPIGAG